MDMEMDMVMVFGSVWILFSLRLWFWVLAFQLLVWPTNKSGSELHFNWLAKLLQVLDQVQNVLYVEIHFYFRLGFFYNSCQDSRT